MTISESELRDLRLKYQAAYSAYQSCVTALTEAGASGERPLKRLLEQEASALRELTEARERYRDALMQIAFADPKQH